MSQGDDKNLTTLAASASGGTARIVEVPEARPPRSGIEGSADGPMTSPLGDAATGNYFHAGTTLRPYNPPSWFHPKGIYKVLAKLHPKLPDVEGKLFLTFTFDRLLFGNESLAFDHGRDRLRRIFFELRRGVTWEGKKYVIDAPYCVKVEFHADGWPHFHAIFLTRRFLPAKLLAHLWGLGRVNVGRISNDEFRYLLKYVTKGGTLPDWALNRHRLRVFQSSRGFYTSSALPKETTPRVGLVKRRTTSLGQRLERWRRTGLLESGENREQIILSAPYSELLAKLIFSVAKEGRYLGAGRIQINDSQELFPWINQTSVHP